MIGCGLIGAGVGAADVQGAAQHAGVLCPRKPAVAHPRKACRVGEGDEACVVIRLHGQRGLGDVGGGRRAGGVDGAVVAQHHPTGVGRSNGQREVECLACTRT